MPVIYAELQNILDDMTGVGEEKDYIIKMFKKLEEEKEKLKEEAATNQRRSTMYRFMSEYMEEADCMGGYFDYIRENYPDKQKEAGVLSD